MINVFLMSECLLFFVCWDYVYPEASSEVSQDVASWLVFHNERHSLKKKKLGKVHETLTFFLGDGSSVSIISKLFFFEIVLREQVTDRNVNLCPNRKFLQFTYLLWLEYSESYTVWKAVKLYENKPNSYTKRCLFFEKEWRL